MNTIFLMGPGVEGAQGGTSILIPLALMMVVMYFFMIRPNQKKQKAVTAFRDGLAQGNKVVTVGGIHGKVSSVQETTVVLKTEDGSTFMVEKSALLQSFNPIQNGRR